MKARKFNKYQRKENREQKLRNSLAGSGLFVYENNTNGDLSLPKPTATGKKSVGPKEKFQGDSYYQTWCKPPMNLLKFIDTITPVTALVIGEKTTITEAIMPEKLILDQPDTITHAGKVEHVVEGNSPKLVETSTPTDTLLTEDPLEGVEIILG